MSTPPSCIVMQQSACVAVLVFLEHPKTALRPAQPQHPPNPEPLRLPPGLMAASVCTSPLMVNPPLLSSRLRPLTMPDVRVCEGGGAGRSGRGGKLTEALSKRSGVRARNNSPNSNGYLPNSTMSRPPALRFTPTCSCPSLHLASD